MSFTAKSVILDIADNWGAVDYLGIRSVDFYLAGSKITNIATTDFVAYATSNGGVSYLPAFAFDTSLEKLYPSSTREWAAAYEVLTNQRLICVFNTAEAIDEIRINNSHSTGSLTSRGAENIKITLSEDAITDTTYDAAVANSSVVFDDVLDEHINSNVEDEQIILLTDPAKSGGVIRPFFKGGKVQAQTFSGTVSVDGAPAVRTILVCLDRAPEVVFTTESESDGTWSITINMPYDDTARIICVGNTGENSEIYEHLVE